jgi:hypothetical protein
MSEGPAEPIRKLLPAGLDEVPPPQFGPHADSDATREAAAFASGNLEELTKRGEHKRTERFREHISMGALCFIWILFALFLIATLCLAFHYLTPRRWGWLEQDQLDTLRTIVFSGAITSTATAYFIKRVA